MPEQIPTMGRIVHYTLTAWDAEIINRRRADAMAHRVEHRDNANGVVLHVGNVVNKGDVFPAIIVRPWGEQPASACNLQVLLDGSDTYWVTSRCGGDGPGLWSWPPRV